MAKWSGSADSGILRKKQPEKHEDLLVFGYACKLFRDDEKAKYIDQGKHLIPWMGDDKLKIDRYDGRGALAEISSCEASREGYDAMRWLGLSDSERRIEQLCDQERYYSLHINEEEEELYKEEELKRIQQKSNEFQYSYDVPQNDENAEQGPLLKEEYADVEEEPFVSPIELDVPADIAIPKTMKENARIEKTALFVSRQGPQMEILIKAKQADNPQFAFLNNTDKLYKYYRHLLNAIKTGRYKVKTENSEEEEKSNSAENAASNENYLHPSLLATSVSSAQIQAPLPQVPYRPSPDCKYSQLVNRIQGTQAENKTEAPVPVTQTQMTYEQQQYYQYYYATQYYEYCKQMSQYQARGGSSGDDTQKGLNNQNAENPEAQNAYLNYAQMAAYVQYMQQQQQASSNPYAQIVSNLNKDTNNSYSALVEGLQQIAPNIQNSDIAKAPILYNKNKNSTENNATIEEKVQETVVVAKEVSVSASKETKPVVEVRKPLSFLAEYGSDSDEETSSENEEKATVKVPPGETQIVIDKMASYVAKNGTDFEAIVKSKGDPRFDFLNESHEYHGYYRKKIEEFSSKQAKEVPEEDKKVEEVTKTVPKTPPTKVREKKVIAPVCFSIKKPKEDPPKEIKSALPVEESSDEEDEAQTATKSSSVSGTSTPVINSTNTVNNSTSCAPEMNTGSNVDVSDAVVQSNGSTEKVAEVAAVKNGILDSDDPILEMIDLTDDLEERKDAKRAEDRIKDKLAAAAREKLASVSRDRALQMERRKKAAAFLKLKSAESDVSKTTANREEKVKKRVSEEEEKRVVEEKVHKDSEVELEEGEVKKRKSKRKKSHKRKHSKSKQEKSRKKSKKRRHRSDSEHSHSSSSA